MSDTAAPYVAGLVAEFASSETCNFSIAAMGQKYPKILGVQTL